AAQQSRGAWPLVLCRAGRDGLTLHARAGGVAVRYHVPGERPAAAVSFPASVLAAFEGATPAPAMLEPVSPKEGRARRDDGGVPRELAFEAEPPDRVPPFPEPPAAWAELPGSFLEALQQASLTAAKESARFAVTRLQLRGRRGEVVGTDGRQLLAW